MNYTQAAEKLEKYGQTHILKYYDELGEEEKKELLKQIEETDFSVLSLCKKGGSEVKKGKNCGENAGFVGHKHTKEVRELLSELAKQKVGDKNPKARKVIRLSDCKIYGYLGSAAQEANIGRNAMINRCKKHKGFMYYDEWLTEQSDFKNNN